MKKITIKVFVCVFCLVIGYFLKTAVDVFLAPSVLGHSVIRMSVNRNPESYTETTFVIVDQYGIPVPNARVNVKTSSGYGQHSLTNEFGFARHTVNEYDVLAIMVNNRIVYEVKSYLLTEILPPFSPYESLFLVKIDTALP